jgi:hypothetical protein
MNPQTAYTRDNQMQILQGKERNSVGEIYASRLRHNYSQEQLLSDYNQLKCKHNNGGVGLLYANNYSDLNSNSNKQNPYKIEIDQIKSRPLSSLLQVAQDG